MSISGPELEIKIIDNTNGLPASANFYARPPLTGIEKEGILESQGPRSILAELLTYPDTEDASAVFATHGFDNEANFVMGEALANAVMAIRGISKAHLNHNGIDHEILA